MGFVIDNLVISVPGKDAMQSGYYGDGVSNAISLGFGVFTYFNAADSFIVLQENL
jgi:hypothetical protein